MYDPNTIAGRITLARLYAGLSKAALADALGVSRTTTTNWEHEDPERQKDPGEEILSKISLVTGVDLGWLKTGQGDGPPLHVTEPQVLYENVQRRRPSSVRQHKAEERDMVAAVVRQRPELEGSFHRTLEHHGVLRQRFDFVSDTLVAEWVPRGSPFVHRALWLLAVLKKLDDSAAIKRRAVLFLLPENRTRTHPYTPRYLAEQAEVMGVQVVDVDGMPDISRFILGVGDNKN